MYFTTKQIALEFIRTKQNINDIILLLQIVRNLVSRYGISIYTNKINNIIKLNNKDIGDIINILYKTGKRRSSDISQIINIIKKEYPSYKKRITIKAPTNIQNDIIKKISSKFDNLDINKENYDKGIMIKGEGYSYSRIINNDIDKLLK